MRRDKPRTQVQDSSLSFNNQMKQKWTKTTPRGKQVGRQAANYITGNHNTHTHRQTDTHTHTQRKTMDQHRTTDTWRINRETNKEGNEGDTGGATKNNYEVTRWEGTDNRQQSTWHKQQTTSHVLNTDTVTFGAHLRPTSW